MAIEGRGAAARRRRTAVIFLAFGQATGWLGLVGLWSNWRYFVA